MWAVGCLIMEAALGEALFPSESEIEHLYKVFRCVGTPDPLAWPDVLLAKCWTARFPVYKPLDFELLGAFVNGEEVAVCSLFGEVRRKSKVALGGRTSGANLRKVFTAY